MKRDPTLGLSYGSERILISVKALKGRRSGLEYGGLRKKTLEDVGSV